MTARITSDPGICGGKPCIAGTRMRVLDVLELLAAGAPVEEIIEDYPYVTVDDIKACLTYAAQQMDHPIIAVDVAAE